MDRLRLPFFVLAAVLILLVVLLEAGSSWMPKVSKPELTGAKPADPNAQMILAQIKKAGTSDTDVKRLSDQHAPGLAIPAMALLDGLVLFTILIYAAPYVLGDRLSGKLQGVVMLIAMIIVILVGIVLLLKDLGLLLLMVSLFLAAPFGTIAYLVVWGFFDTGQAQIVLSLSMFLKLAFVVMLLLAQQQFIKFKGLILIILTTLLANIIVSFLQGLVPGFLVSITDAVGALIVLILTLIWALFMLIGSIIAIVKAVT